MYTNIYDYVMLISLILFILVLIFSIIEIIMSSSYSKPAKLFWFSMCLFMPFLGSALFHIYRKDKLE
ncbi:hypothetical protein [Halpernia sp.]|uniref:hypothetical protein n=1 Tax=Halpernia sp. TaxID=2782209 RepID=UPI003A9473DE